MGIMDSIKSAMMPTTVIQNDEKLDIPVSDRTRYRTWISNAEEYHKKRFYKAAMRFIKYYRSEPDKDALAGTNFDIFCNEIWTNVQTMLPSLYFQNPEPSIEAEQEKVETTIPDPNTGQPMKKPDGTPMMLVTDCAKSASLQQEILKDYFRSMDLKDSIQRAVIDALVTGFGCIKGGWNTELIGSENDNLQLMADDMTLERFNPLNMLIDPEWTKPDLSDAKYIVFRYIKPTDIIKKNPMYKGVKNLAGINRARYSGEDAKETRFEDVKLTVEENTIYEVWDFVNKKLAVFVDNLDYPIRFIDWPLKLTGFPVKLLVFNPDPEGGYPIPEFKAIEGIMLAKTKIRRKMIDLMLKLNRIYGVKKGSISKNDLQNVLDAKDGGVAEFDVKQGESIEGVIRNINDFVMSDSLVSLQNIADSDIERMSGIADFQRGMISEAKRTATEMLNLSSQMNLRVEMKKDNIARFVEDVSEMMLELLQQNLSGDKVQKLTGEQGTQWLTYNSDDLRGKYRVKIDVGDMVKTNPSMRLKEALERYDRYQANPLVNKVELVKLLEQAADNKQVDKLFNQQEVQGYLNPQPKPDKPLNLSVSLKLMPMDLQNPNVLELLKTAGVTIQPIPVENAPQGQLEASNSNPSNQSGGVPMGTQELQSGQVNPMQETGQMANG